MEIGAGFAVGIRGGLIGLLLCAGLLWPMQAVAAGLMLPKVYTDQTDVTGWLMSEKLDGVRGYWDGRQLLSKNGNRFYPPEEFIRDLPSFPLEGELWAGRGCFEETVSIVKKQLPHAGWLKLRFAIFDVPQAAGGFRNRLKAATTWFAAHPPRYAFILPQRIVHGQDHLQQDLQRIELLGGEGLIVRSPAAVYTAGRSAQILKVKNYQDAEAAVLAHLPGKGRNLGRLGALLVQQTDGTEFRIGSGFSDAERESPPAVGSLVTYKYYGNYRSGLPKFPSFLRVRADTGL